MYLHFANDVDCHTNWTSCLPLIYVAASFIKMLFIYALSLPARHPSYIVSHSNDVVIQSLCYNITCHMVFYLSHILGTATPLIPLNSDMDHQPPHHMQVAWPIFSSLERASNRILNISKLDLKPNFRTLASYQSNRSSRAPKWVRLKKFCSRATELAKWSTGHLTSQNQVWSLTDR